MAYALPCVHAVASTVLEMGHGQPGLVDKARIGKLIQTKGQSQSQAEGDGARSRMTWQGPGTRSKTGTRRGGTATGRIPAIEGSEGAAGAGVKSQPVALPDQSVCSHPGSLLPASCACWVARRLCFRP